MEYNNYNNTSNNISGEAEAVWDKCLGIIKDNVNWRTFQTWFEPIKAVALSNSILTLQVPSQFFLRMVGRTLCRVAR